MAVATETRGTVLQLAYLVQRQKSLARLAAFDFLRSGRLPCGFEWLSTGDVTVRQELENYFKQLKKAYTAQALKDRMDIVASYLDKSAPENRVVQTVKIGNHVVDIKWTNLADGMNDSATVNKLQEEKRKREQATEMRKNAVGWVFAIALVLFC